MLCEKCQKNEANIFLTQNTNGSITKMNLCSDCAGKMDKLGCFFDAPFEVPFAGFAPISMGRSNSDASLVCPVCSTSLSTLIQGQKPGCPNCYEVFARYFSDYARQIHGSHLHRGKRPRSIFKEIPADNEPLPENSNSPAPQSDPLSKLKTDLQSAIESEEFEMAAALRDEIKKMREGGDDIAK